jgi:uncharacterized protein Smg (DUF494 family)
MLALLAPLLSFFGGPVISGLIDAYKAKLAAVNSQDQHAVDLAVADLNAQIEARKEASILAGNKLAGFVQFMFAMPIIIYEFKVIVYDKVLALGSTDPINGTIGQWASLIISFYFGGQIVSGVVTTVARRFGK